MENQQDSLTNCPHCLCDAMYVTKIAKDIYNKQCFGCGYYTTSMLKEGNEFYNTQIDILPELYKDLSWKDELTQEIWFPTTINIPDKGMIFANGKSKETWKWAAVKAVDIPKEDQHRFPNPNKKGEFYERKMDMTTLKQFDQKEFIEAMEFLDLLN